MYTRRITNAIALTLSACLEGWEDKTNPIAVEQGMKFLVNKNAPDFNDDTAFYGTANFAGVSKDGKLYSCIGRACHSTIGSMPDEHRHAVATENGATRSGKDLKNVELFLEWLLYHSPYSMFIVNRNDFDFCLNHGFIVSGMAPYKLLQNLMIITRHFKECHENCFKTFDDLVLNHGVDPLVAYSCLFNSNISSKAGSYQSTEAHPSTVYQDHGAHRVTTTYTLEGLLNIVKGNLIAEPGEPYIELASIQGGSKLWKSGGKVSFSIQGMEYPGLNKAIRISRGEAVDDVKIYHPPNPFAPKTYRTDMAKRFTCDEAVKVAIPWLDAALKEKLANG